MFLYLSVYNEETVSSPRDWLAIGVVNPHVTVDTPRITQRVTRLFCNAWLVGVVQKFLVFSIACRQYTAVGSSPAPQRLVREDGR